MKKNILIVFWLFLAISGSLYAQTVFLEDFNEGSTFPEGWEINIFPDGCNPYASEYKIANSSWCLGGGQEFNSFYWGKAASKFLPYNRIELISPILNLAAFEQLNFTIDFFRQEYDRVDGALRIRLYVRNDQMEDWTELYFHDYYFWGNFFLKSKPFVCSLDPAIFQEEGFRFMLLIDLNIIPISESLYWFNMDNIKIEVAPQTDLALFDQYPDLHIPSDSLFSPKVRLVNKGIETMGGQVRCSIWEHKSNELVYEESVDIPDMARMDTLSLVFPAFNLPYLNHLYHLDFELDCAGDENPDNNLIGFEVDTYTTAFHNWIGLNVFYSREYSHGTNFLGKIYNLHRVLDTLNLVKQSLAKVCPVNYVYDDVADSLDCQTAVSYMHDLGITYAPTTPIRHLNGYIPDFSLYPRRFFRAFNNRYNSMFNSIRSQYKRLAEYRSPFTLSIYGTHYNLDYDLTIELTPKAPIVNDRLKLRTVITRSHVPSNANPEIPDDYRVEYFDDVAQMALPDTNGIAFAMDGSETSAMQWEMSFSLKDFWDPEQVKIVTYVQDTFTYDILQCRAVPLQNLWGVGMEEEAQTPAESVLISPNPAKDMLYAQVMLEMPANVDFRLFDINGRDLGILKRSFLGAGNHKVQINVPKHIKTGTYILQTETEREVYSQKLNIVR